MTETTFSAVEKKLTELGIDALTMDEKAILKAGIPTPEKMVNTDDYTKLQTDAIERKQEHGVNLTDTEKTVMVGKEVDNKNELVDIIISGQNDVWTKTYDYTKSGGLKFTISIKVPTIVEEGMIMSQMQAYLGGTATVWDDYTTGVYHTLAMIRVCGKRVPDVFADDDKIYAVIADWLYKIGVDFSDWESRFRY